VSPELAYHLTAVSHEIGRQVGVLMSRDGTVRKVVVGDAEELQIPEIGRLRGGAGRLRGLRLVHTHLRGEPLTADDLNDLALLRLDMVAVIQVRPNGRPGSLEIAHVVPLKGEETEDDGGPIHRMTFSDVGGLDFDFGDTVRALESEFSKLLGRGGADTSRERALVIGVRMEDERFEETLELARSAEVVVAGQIRQRRPRPHQKTVVGSGKLRQIVLESMRRQADVAIFDVDLSPAQARAFEDRTGLKVVDRTQLIMDIFAQRARSRDGKLQVELAQLKYSLPRLSEKDGGLSRLTGGIGGRGPGETVLEVGRRRIRDRIRKLEKQVARLSKERSLRRRRRQKNNVPVVSIIGYTNAGKTTLLNALTKSSVETDDKLFVTLDPTTRRLRFPREGEVIITDTVGFLRDMPADLVAAFKATLEELAEANVLLHVVDASDEDVEEKLKAVRGLLSELKLLGIPGLLVLNKCDLLDAEQVRVLVRYYEGIAVSASARTGLSELIDSTERLLSTRFQEGNPSRFPSGSAVGGDRT